MKKYLSLLFLGILLFAQASWGIPPIPPPTGLLPTGTASGDLSGSYPNPTVAKVNGVTPGSASGVATLNGSSLVVQNPASIPTVGTGVGTALGININTAGSPVINGGALGTPSSGNLEKCTFGAYDTTFNASLTIDFSTGNTQKVTLTNNVTSLTLSNMLAGGVYAIAFVQGGSGSYTVAFPASDSTHKWKGGSLPTLTTTVGATDWIIIRVDYDGIAYFDSDLNFS